MRSVIITLTLFLYFALSMSAQPVLNAGNSNPVPGDKYYRHIFDESHISVGDSGANAYWAFTSLVDINTVDTEKYMNCYSTPYCGIYPDANVVLNVLTTYSYMRCNDTNVTHLGFDNIRNVDLFEGKKYPFTYHSYDTGYGMRIASGDTFYNYYSEYGDGYGTLKLATGIYPNVLRTRYCKRTICHTSPSIYNYDYSYVFYMWYKPGIHTPLLTVQVDGDIPVLAVRYVDPAHPVDIEEINTNTVHPTIFPNPVTDNSLNINTENEDIISADLYDAKGRKIETWYVPDGIRRTAITCHTTRTLIGIYFLQITTNNGIYRQSITFQ